MTFFSRHPLLHGHMHQILPPTTFFYLICGVHLTKSITIFASFPQKSLETIFFVALGGRRAPAPLAPPGYAYVTSQRRRHIIEVMPPPKRAFGFDNLDILPPNLCY